VKLKRVVEILAARPLLFRQDLARRYGCDVRTIDRMVADGRLPRGNYLRGSSIPQWSADEIADAEERNSKLKQLIFRRKKTLPAMTHSESLTLPLFDHHYSRKGAK